MVGDERGWRRSAGDGGGRERKQWRDAIIAMGQLRQPSDRTRTETDGRQFKIALRSYLVPRSPPSCCHRSLCASLLPFLSAVLSRFSFFPPSLKFGNLSFLSSILVGVRYSGIYAFKQARCFLQGTKRKSSSSRLRRRDDVVTRGNVGRGKRNRIRAGFLVYPA